MVTVLEILASGFTPQNVLTCLKTGFFGYPEEDIRLFENYLSLWSVRPSGLETPFVYPVRGMTKRRGEQDGELLTRIEFLRRDFTGRLLDLRRQTEGKTVREISERLYSFLLSLGIEEHMRNAAELYLKFGEQALYAEHLQVYDLILESLDEIVLTCGKDVLTLTEYSDLVLSVLDSKDIAILPTAADEVMTGNMNRLPYLGQKILFAVGLSEGVFPETPSGDALLSETDKTLLNQNDITVGMTNRQKVMYERLLAFFTFTAPEKILYLTCPEKDRPSPFWRELCRMFPLAQVSFSPMQSGGKALENRICTERSAFSVYAKTKIEPLAQIFEKSPRYRRLLQRRTGRDLLFGTDILLSPSKAERFFQCPFSYFLSEGLGISAPETVRIGGVQFGNFMHEALEKLLPAALAGTPSGELVQGFSSVYLEELFGGQTPTASVREYFAMLEQKAGRLLRKFRFPGLFLLPMKPESAAALSRLLLEKSVTAPFLSAERWTGLIVFLPTGNICGLWIIKPGKKRSALKKLKTAPKCRCRFIWRRFSLLRGKKAPLRVFYICAPTQRFVPFCGILRLKWWIVPFGKNRCPD